MDCLFGLKSLHVPTMSLSSRPKKLKAKGKFQELKLVQTISRSGFDTIKTEEVQTPRRSLKSGQSTSQTQQFSSSPTKRPKLGHFDEEPIPWNLEEVEALGKRQTLVFIYFFMIGISV
jgi:hypothetical protein